MPTKRGKSVTTTITLPETLYLAVKKLPIAKCQSFSSLVRNLLIEETCKRKAK